MKAEEVAMMDGIALMRSTTKVTAAFFVDVNVDNAQPEANYLGL